jgi:hypothetical protein
LEKEMNEVFENLAEQAMIHVPGSTGLHTRAFSLEKFAELIVQECADIIENSRIEGDLSVCLVGATKCKIKQHFGVTDV